MRQEFMRAGQITEADFIELCELHYSVFPKRGRSLEDVITKRRPLWMNPPIESPPPFRFVIRSDGKIAATAAALYRIVTIECMRIPILGLMDVATSSEHRRRGFARTLIQRMFSLVDNITYDACLFQTEHSSYYESLGAYPIKNPVVNSTNPNSMMSEFGQQIVMVYTSGLEWPSGTVDVRGPAW